MEGNGFEQSGLGVGVVGDERLGGGPIGDVQHDARSAHLAVGIEEGPTDWGGEVGQVLEVSRSGRLAELEGVGAIDGVDGEEHRPNLAPGRRRREAGSGETGLGDRPSAVRLAGGSVRLCSPCRAIPTLVGMQQLEQTRPDRTGDEVVDRMLRVIGRAHRQRSGPGYFLAQMGVLAACCFGAWWTVQAVVDVRPWAMVFRFVLSAALGVYYVVLARLVRVPQRRP